MGNHPPQDRLTVVEIDQDGSATRITHFVDKLNIPIGQTPLGDGNEALVYGIPSIFHVRDTTGDGQADRQSALYTGFGNVDTHGMASSFTRWIDGWIYGCHGFSNRSEITDSQGRVVRMQSGNTYRFREDGSEFQQFTFGQVNPFGMTFDPYGNLYDADCHSMPVYLLLRGADYPHFGKQPDGLGFGPTMIDHNHGSTGICGPAYYAADHFPPDFRDNLFICNPVTGRVHRDKLKRFGSTYHCDTQADMITTDDKWFRPVDVTVGPDGALYIADFCNLIIGHYEAPLDHPDRDRRHGRVWRLVYRGEDGSVAPPGLPDLTTLSAAELVDRLADVNLTVRTLATNYLVDAHAADAPALVRQAMEQRDEPLLRAHGLWILERLSGLDDSWIERLAGDEQPLVRVHLMKLLAERAEWKPSHFELARRALGDDDGFVRRAAADALGQHPAADNVRPLLEAWSGAPSEDTHLIHMIRLALRNHVGDQQVVQQVLNSTFDTPMRRRLVEIATATDSDAAMPLLLYHAEPAIASAAVLDRAATQVARYGTPEQLLRLVEVAPQWFADDAGRQFQLLSAIGQGLDQRGLRLQEQSALRDWFARLAPPMLDALTTKQVSWSHHPVPGLPSSDRPWGIRHRGSTDGHATALFWDSIVGGEQRTGILRSPPFTLPGEFSFWMCGHNGPPGSDEPPVNHVRLVLVETGEVIAKEVPPRNDQARQYTWSLEEHAGQQAVLEIVDAHQGGAFAWIGVGRFDPPRIRVPSPDTEQHAQRLVSLVGQFGLEELADRLPPLADSSRQPLEVRLAAVDNFRRLGPQPEAIELLAKLLAGVDEPQPLRSRVAALLGSLDDAAARQELADQLQRTPAALQRDIAQALVQNVEGIPLLLDLVAAGKASPHLLQDPQLEAALSGSASREQKQQIAALTERLPEPNEQLAARIAEHRDGFAPQASSAARGREVYTKNCAACHRIGELGKVVGPQLDGIGNRGLERLLEDVLDPNRNVDVAFRTLVIRTDGGQVITGLERRREGQVLVLADNQGQEIRIPLADIDQQRVSSLSIMPANFAETLAREELHDLLAFLLSHSAEQAEE